MKDQKQGKWRCRSSKRCDSTRRTSCSPWARASRKTAFYIYATFLLAYATQALGPLRQQILNAVLIAAAIETFTIPAFGPSDKFGRRPVYMFGAIFSGAMAFLLFALLGTKDQTFIVLADVARPAVGHASMYGPQAGFLSELFGTKVRYSRRVARLQSPSLLAGALAADRDGPDDSLPETWPISLYMIGLALITVVAVFFAAETRKTGTP